MEKPVTAAYRLSPMQEQVWVFERASESPPYIVQCALQLYGPVDPGRLKNAIAQVVARHEILRTIYVRQPGVTSPFQVISDVNRFSWELVEDSNEG